MKASVRIDDGFKPIGEIIRGAAGLGQRDRAVPEIARHQGYRPLWGVLGGEGGRNAFAPLSDADRGAILEILEETDSGFAAGRGYPLSRVNCAVRIPDAILKPPDNYLYRCVRKSGEMGTL